MSKQHLVNIISIFLFCILCIKTKEESQVKIYSYSSNEDGEPYIDPFDDDTEINTTDKNCNFKEYPEQAKKCNNETMKCLDEVRKHHCSCIKGYITFVNDTKNVKYCNFKQKKQLIAFLLEFCVGFGAGHFYRHHFLMASLKLVAFISGIVFIFTFPITAKKVADCDCEAIAIILSILYYLYLCGLAFWYIWDLVHFGKNKYLDYTYKSQIGQGIAFEPW